MISTASPMTRMAQVPSDPLDAIPAGAVVAVAMSGGVDSSVAAARCVDAGLDTFGITLAMWPRNPEATRDRGCCSIDAVDDARQVCQTLGIPHYSWNLEERFNEAVIADFEAEYAAGRTPNPCVRCNERVKFGTLLTRARAAGATHLATGHYAQRGRRGQTWTLHRAADSKKDQSYTLHRLDQDQLGAAVFPLGAFNDKAAVRALAASKGLGTAAKPDSQELCFVDISVREELRSRLAGRYSGGDIVTGDGTVVGRHDGLPFYTVGQRSHLGIAPTRPDSEPLYVLKLEPESNRVVVGPADALLQHRVVADQARWIAGEPPEVGMTVDVQLGAHGHPHSATICDIGTELALDFDPAVRRVSPGQPMVVLVDDEILGGGIVISEPQT